MEVETSSCVALQPALAADMLFVVLRARSVHLHNAARVQARRMTDDVAGVVLRSGDAGWSCVMYLYDDVRSRVV